MIFMIQEYYINYNTDRKNNLKLYLNIKINVNLQFKILYYKREFL